MLARILAKPHRLVDLFLAAMAGHALATDHIAIALFFAACAIMPWPND